MKFLLSTPRYYNIIITEILRNRLHKKSLLSLPYHPVLGTGQVYGAGSLKKGEENSCGKRGAGETQPPIEELL